MVNVLWQACPRWHFGTLRLFSQVDDIDIGNISLYGVDPHGPVSRQKKMFLCLKAPFN